VEKRSATMKTPSLKKQSMSEIYARTRSHSQGTTRHEAFDSGYADGIEWSQLENSTVEMARELFKPFNRPSTMVVNDLIGTKRFTRESLLKLAVILGVNTKEIKRSTPKYFNALRNYDTGFLSALSELIENQLEL
jgi:hypothetical protein